jgi:hypothetical protein
MSSGRAFIFTTYDFKTKVTTNVCPNFIPKALPLIGKQSVRVAVLRTAPGPPHLPRHSCRRLLGYGREQSENRAAQGRKYKVGSPRTHKILILDRKTAPTTTVPNSRPKHFINFHNNFIFSWKILAISRRSYSSLPRLVRHSIRLSTRQQLLEGQCVRST